MNGEHNQPTPLELTDEAQQPVSAEINNQEPYSTEYLARLFVQSYYFSQGSSAFQESILYYITEQNHDRIRPELIEPATKQAEAQIRKITENPALHSNLDKLDPGKIAESVQEEIIKWLGFVTRRDHDIKSPDWLIGTMLRRDARFLLGTKEPKGQYVGEEDYTRRPREVTKDAARAGALDPYTSQLVNYCFMDKPTGMPEYDAMFDEMREHFAEFLYTYDHHTLDDVVKVHLLHHPEEKTLIAPEIRKALTDSFGAERTTAMGVEPLAGNVNE